MKQKLTQSEIDALVAASREPVEIDADIVRRLENHGMFDIIDRTIVVIKNKEIK